MIELVSKVELLKHFDDIIAQFEEYHKKFDDHLAAMDAERAKAVEGKRLALAKLEEIKELRDFVEKRVK